MQSIIVDEYCAADDWGHEHCIYYGTLVDRWPPAKIDQRCNIKHKPASVAYFTYCVNSIFCCAFRPCILVCLLLFWFQTGGYERKYTVQYLKWNFLVLICFLQQVCCTSAHTVCVACLSTSTDTKLAAVHDQSYYLRWRICFQLLDVLQHAALFLNNYACQRKECTCEKFLRLKEWTSCAHIV